MKGDFTRNTFDPLQHFSRVLMQQGRVQLDADWNEQAEITLHYLRSLAADLIGEHGGRDTAFLVGERLDGGEQGVAGDFTVGAGHYYVNGVLCENEGEGLSYKEQSGHGIDPGLPAIVAGPYLAYLDVWERHLTHLEAPGVREPALGGPDTASRARVEWQVKLARFPDGFDLNPAFFKTDHEAFKAFLEEQNLYQDSQGVLMAAVPPTNDTSDACVIAADNRYRGIENQLYRVEIHRGGNAWDGDESGTTAAATFKWSRENGSVVFAVSDVHVNGANNITTVTLEHTGRDSKLGLAKDDWVELVDDDYVLRNDAQPLLRVLATDLETMTVTLEGQAGAGVGSNTARHPLLRRWDQRAGAATGLGNGMLVRTDASSANGLWIKLEDGIEVKFKTGVRYNTGDYWLIPARTGSGDIEWPRASPGSTLPAWVRPRGIVHHYAPLAALEFGAGGKFNATNFIDLRRKLIALWT